MDPRRAIALPLCLAALLALLPACAGRQAAGDQAAVAGGPDYVALYASGRYAAAKPSAEAAARSATGRDREQALLFAGMSAHALGQAAEAERTLTPLLSSRDDDVSGRAAATLGLIAQAGGRHERAAELLTAAAARLGGDEAAKAAMHAGDSLESLGRRAEARAQFTAAAATATDRRLKTQIADRLESGRFAVQLGVFSQKRNAQRAVAEATPTAARFGFGMPRMVQRTDAKGRPEFVVRVEPFPTRHAASTARSRLGSGTVVALTPAD